MKVGYFTQCQFEDLDADDAPLEHMTRIMRGASPAAVRAQPRRLGFSDGKAARRPTSAGAHHPRRAAQADPRRPTNHLDVDARNALDRAMFDPKTAEPRLAKLAMSDLMKRRADTQDRIDAL